MKTKKAFSIKTDWLPNQSSRIGDEPNEDMIANLTIDLLGSKLTRNFDLDDREIRDSVALAPYPLTLWLVGYWWRLRWESTPWQPSYGWFKSHTLSSAGYGYCWPFIGFETDGENIHITSRFTDGSSVMYLTDFAGSIPAREYEETVTAFIEDCLARTGSSDAGDIWELVQEERQDAEMSLYRQLEAVLGYNMGNGPEDVIDQLVRQSGDLGRSAVREAARLLLSGDVREEVDALQKSGTGTRISLDSDLLRLGDTATSLRADLAPDAFGRELAGRVRGLWSITDVLSTETLCARLGADRERLFSPTGANKGYGLGMRHDNGTFSVLFTKRFAQRARFTMARLLCEAITAPGDDRLLPATPERTARQRTQRAFAAELLCPVASIRERLEAGSPDEDTLEDIAEEFDVSDWVVDSQLASMGLTFWRPDGYVRFTGFPRLRLSESSSGQTDASSSACANAQ